MVSLKKIIPVLIFGLIFILVITKISPPPSFTSFTLWQIPAFFLPLFFLLAFLLNIFLKFFAKSAVISLGIIILLVLKGLDALNMVSFILAIAAVILVARSLRKPKNRLPQSSVPRLSRLLKQH